MEISTAYLPQEVFAPPSGSQEPPPRVFLAPQRYVQGPNVLADAGRYLSLLDAKHVAVLLSERRSRQEGARLIQSLAADGIESTTRIFRGECSVEEIEAHAADLDEKPIDCLLAVGGGKCIDTGKAVAFRLGIPVVVVPTLASNDAPCSALSVLYSPEGVSVGVEFYPQNPALVIVDTKIVAEAPERFLVAGMGDAMATWYEARVCLSNEDAVTTVGARPTLASAAIGEICAKTLFEQGRAAAEAVAESRVDDALERVVEANTLLSGLGFESGGLAAAHGVAQSYTGIPSVHADYLHGEMVAMGTLAQLAMESRIEEAEKVAEFFATVGLPIHLGQLSLAPTDTAALRTIIDGTLAFPFIANMPMPVNAKVVEQAVIRAHELGAAVAERVGDQAYRRLQED
ncbi:MAG: glycerol dehydrogenase [Gammaproteobacteria bacterium]|jgi:glycerol dehydrogenase